MDGGEGFVSMAEIFEEEEFDKNRVNIALPGFRVGVIYSYNAIVGSFLWWEVFPRKPDLGVYNGKKHSKKKLMAVA